MLSNISKKDVQSIIDKCNHLEYISGDVNSENVMKWFQLKKSTNFGAEDMMKLFKDLFIGNAADFAKEIEQCFKYFDKDCDNLLNATEFQDFCDQFLSRIFKPKTALLIIDVQNDFISGSLAVKNCPAHQDGEDVIPLINKIVKSHTEKKYQFDLIVYTSDWHPDDHISFYANLSSRVLSKNSPIKIQDAKIMDEVIFKMCDGEEIRQILWPKHCVQGTNGASLHKDLIIANDSCNLKKGMNSDADSYSAFGLSHPKALTELHTVLQEQNIHLLFTCGIATDICVAQTSFDALKLRYQVALIEDACRGVNAENIDKTKNGLVEQQAIVISSHMIPYILNGRVRPIQVAVSMIKNLVN